MNTLIVVKMGKVGFDEWKTAFESDKEAQATFMRDALVGKVDESTAMVAADIFDHDKMKAMMTSPEFAQMESDMGLSHSVFVMSPAPGQ